MVTSLTSSGHAALSVGLVVVLGVLSVALALLSDGRTQLTAADAGDDHALLPCANGTVLTDSADQPGLFADCAALVEASDALRGTATLETLDWSATWGSLPEAVSEGPGLTTNDLMEIRGWGDDSIELAGSQRRVFDSGAVGGTSSRDPQIRSGGTSETAIFSNVARSSTTLVSNLTQGGDTHVNFTNDHGQAFTTGYHGTGYTVTSVAIISEDPEADDIALQICEVDSHGHPTTTCTDLTAPDASGAGTLTFTVPDDTTLTLFSVTTYMVVFKSPGGESVRVDATSSADNDSDSLQNWSIRDSFQWKPSSWQDGNGSKAIRIAIHGTVNPASATAPTAMDSNVTATEETAYPFSAADFRFSGVTPSDALTSVKILMLPRLGTLLLNHVAVTANQSVTKDQLDDGNLTYTPPTDGYGTGYAGFLFQVRGSTETSNFPYTMTVDVTGVPDPATGMPDISGSAEGRRTLTALTAGIADPDGLSGVVFSYQWKRYDADGTTFEADIGTDLNTYKLTGAEVGKTVKVAVSFTDDDGGPETRTSAAFPSSGTVGLSMLVSNNEQGDDGQVTLSSLVLGQPFTTGGAAPSYNVTGVTVTSEDLQDDVFALQICDEDRYSQATTTCTNLTPPDSFAAGPLTFTVPTTSTLTLYRGESYMVVFPRLAGGVDVVLDSTDSNSKDADSLPNWSIRDTLRVISSEGWSNFPGGESVRITIHGTANSASSTAPTAMDNSVTTSEDTPYTFTPADFRFSATGGSDTLASVRIRTLPANPRPSGSKPAGGELTLDGAPVTANQSVTRDQLAAGSLEYTPRADDSGSDYTDFLFLVSGSSEESSFAYKMTIDVTAVNDPATGAPTIGGTPEVGETLTASTASIADPDGLTGSFTYQWLQVDSDGTSNPTNIMGATSNTYTLTTSEVGKTVQVEVSFTDSGGGEEERVSTAFPSSGTVVAAPTVNTAPTASNSTVTATEDETYTFLAENFNYSDSDDDPLAELKITRLPASGKGTLKIGSRTIRATDLPKTVTATALTEGPLTYTPPGNQNGAGYASFRFKVNDGTVDSTAEYTMTIDVTSVNDLANAEASIIGTAQVGETLTASLFAQDSTDGGINPNSTPSSGSGTPPPGPILKQT